MVDGSLILATGWRPFWRSAFGVTLALMLSIPPAFVAAVLAYEFIDVIAFPVALLVLATVFGSVTGFATGLAQRLVIRRVVPVAARAWMESTLAGAAGGELVQVERAQDDGAGPPQSGHRGGGPGGGEGERSGARRYPVA